jgi:hypothetical protein
LCAKEQASRLEDNKEYLETQSNINLWGFK